MLWIMNLINKAVEIQRQQVNRVGVLVLIRHGTWPLDGSRG